MGNITSFVKQQIQNLNQLKPQQTTTLEKKPMESSIGQSEFQARKAKFEKQISQTPQLGEEIHGQVESGLNEISGEKLQKTFQLFENTFKGLQNNVDEELEVSETEESQEDPMVKQPSQSLIQKEGEAEMAISGQAPKPTLPQHPKEMPRHPFPQVEEIDLEEEQNDGHEELNREQTEQPQTELINRPVNANHPPSQPPVVHSGKENPLNVSGQQPKQPQLSGADVDEADEVEI